MRTDVRLSSLLHILLHLAEQREPMTSATLAAALGTNPVVVRRILAGLRDKGHVRSEKGHGGGWTLARDPAAITLRDIHDALGRPPLIAAGLGGAPSPCRLERAANAALTDAFAAAEALLLARLGEVTLATLQDAVRGRAHDSVSHCLEEKDHAP